MLEINFADLRLFFKTVLHSLDRFFGIFGIKHRIKPALWETQYSGASEFAQNFGNGQERNKNEEDSGIKFLKMANITAIEPNSATFIG